MDMPPFLRTPVELLKKAYFFFEDRYYALLDQINKVVPVYRVIDPIDKVVPSFAIFTALVAALIIFFVIFSFAAVPLVATLEVVDSKDNALEGVLLEITIQNQKRELLTDDWGQASLQLPAPETSAIVSLSKESFESLKREVTLKANQTTSITMQPTKALSFDPADAEKTIKVYDGSTNRLLTKEVSLSFECRPQGSIPPPQEGSTGEFQITHPRNCDTLIATAEADGYLKKSKTIASKVNYISLTPNVTKTTGDISVIVKDSGGNPEADVIVRALDESTNVEEASSSTGLGGNALLQDLKPGSYTISAISPDGRTGQQAAVQVNAGKTTNVEITLPSSDEVNSKRIYLKLIEQGTQDPVSNAQAFIYDKNVLVDSTASNALGIVEKKLADPKSSYLLVFTHPEFITTVEPNITPTALSDNSPVTVVMTRATIEQPNPTSGELIATVINEDQEAVKNAQVGVYSSLYPSIPLRVPPGKTLDDGTYTFSNLAPGEYFLKAKDEDGKAEGQSAVVDLAAGQSLQVQLTIVLGEGTVEAQVFDRESASKDPIPNAAVEFIDAGDGTTVLDSCTTDQAGKCESGPIAADRFVLVSAAAQAFLKEYAASTVDIVNKSRASVQIGLMHESSIPPTAGKISTEFRLFCDDIDCERPASRIQSDQSGTKTYYALFEIVLAEDASYSGLAHHIRIGPDSEISLPLPNGYKAKIMGVSGPLYSHAVLSSCWNNDTVDPFSEPEGCTADRDAKQANIYYPDLQGKQAIPVVIEFVVEPKLPDGEKLEFHHRAKVVSSGQDLLSSEKVKYFLVNDVLCDQTDFSWTFSLVDGQGQTQVLGTDPNQPNSVTLNEPYDLDYLVYNCSGNDFASASISAENKPAALEVVSFTQSEPFDFGPVNAYSQDSFPFPNGAEISHSLPVFIASEAALSELEFTLQAGAQPSIQSIPLTVSSDQVMQLEHQPDKLPPSGNPDLTGKVMDASTAAPLENVYVTLRISSGSTRSAFTDTDGIFTIPDIDGLAQLASVTLSLRKAGYKTLEKQIEVGASTPAQDPSLDCIKVEKQGFQDTDLFFVKNGTGSEIQDSFTILNQCQQDIVASLRSELQLSPTGNLDVAAGSSRQITVYAKTWQNQPYEIAIGEYGIDVLARFKSADPLAGFNGPIETVRVYVTDPASCFRLAEPTEPSNKSKMKSSFDLRSSLDDGLIVNECFVFFEDLRLPNLAKVAGFSAEEEAYSLVYTSPTQPAEAKVKTKVFDPTADNFDQIGALTFDVTDSAGYVFVDWVDFFMTDSNHLGPDRHQVLAQTHRNVWSNITAQLPYTGTASQPLIDNLGWVDTETYYPQSAVYDDELTEEPIWQGQHNVCNMNVGAFSDPFIPCSVPGYFRGTPLTSYNVGMIANKIRLQTENAGRTEISGLRWQYISTDKSHNGLIDFKVRNNTLMGENYALIEVEDSTGRYFIPGQGSTATGDVEVDWILSKRGSRIIGNQLIPLNQQITIKPGEILGLSADELAQNKYAIATSLPQLYAILGEPVESKELSELIFTTDSSTSPFLFEDNEYVSNYLYLGGQWLRREDFDVENPGQPHVLQFTQSTSAKLIAYENNSKKDIIVNSVQMTWLSRETTQVELARGIATIPLGSSSISFSLPLSNNDLPPANYDSIDYLIEDTTPEALVYFSDTGENTSPNPYASGTQAVAVISSPEEGSATQKERFHIRLIGQPQSQCLGYNGVTGSTGPGSKPRVLFDWDWNAVNLDTCDSENLNFVYCDPTQFTISLIKRLEKIRSLAEQDITGNLLEMRELQSFSVYLVEDAYPQDFRQDFLDFYEDKLLAYDLLDPEHPWGNYLLDNARFVFDTSQARLSTDPDAAPDDKFVAAGLHDIYIDLDFDEDQFDFFYTTGTDVNLLANVTVYITKLSDPVIKNPFYYLPFNGSLGLENGVFQRNGYGLVFDNTSDPLAIVAEGVGGAFYDTSSPQGSIGRKLVGTLRETSFDSANFANRGRVMNVALDQSLIEFLPSIATPVLLEMIPENSKVEAYYNLREQSGGVLSSPASFMNLWTGSGSTIRDSAGNCIDFYGSKLEYRRQDSLAQSGSCATGVQGSYGFNYEPAQSGGKLYFETVFYTPQDDVITLRKSCDNASGLYAPGPDGTQITSNPTYPVSLSIQSSKTNIATMQDIIDLVGQEYVCISSDDDSFSFWWNPQKVLSGLDAAKQEINPDWVHGVACEVAASQP